jgi:hypothetical protein
MRFPKPDSQKPRRATRAYKKHLKTPNVDVTYVREKKKRLSDRAFWAAPPVTAHRKWWWGLLRP